ncbi:serine hydrolase domain-containing protein [Solilutibacter silvestris]|uniref:Beta-lactamase class C and other penicillin binding protein n=1 Tax=Solilutibacter silvestris TaxID=1645665 RepID=A0A2K1Q1X6_9GAMM|nr:serine hydrolase [Lysobacter silvestris]PNS09045.1 Beta-lactamase class C and other penicillin binding protein [Lysobacter silvestris]
MRLPLRLILCLALVGLAACGKHHPAPAAGVLPALIGDGWERADPVASGFDAAKLQATLEKAAGEPIDLHAVVVERHGRLVAEIYRAGKDKGVYDLFATTRDFGPTTLHDVRSVGKSVVSLLIGAARQEGKLDDLSKPVLDFYPEFKDLQTPPRRAITIEHLLTMSSGFEWQEGGPGRDDEHRLYWKWTPAYYALSRPIAAPPGTRFNYNSGGNLVLADILARATATPLKDYARTRLFQPLGITDWEWTGDLHGQPMAFTGLRMRPRDMAKLGRLVLNHGRWKELQLVPAEWIDASLKPRLDTGFDGTRYGYQWWTGSLQWRGKNLPWAAAFGNGSQRIFVVPDLDLCVVVTAGAYGDVAVARRVDLLLQDIVATVDR